MRWNLNLMSFALCELSAFRFALFSHSEYTNQNFLNKACNSGGDLFRRHKANYEALRSRGILRNTACQRNRRLLAERLPQSLSRVANNPISYYKFKSHLCNQRKAHSPRGCVFLFCSQSELDDEEFVFVKIENHDEIGE